MNPLPPFTNERAPRIDGHFPCHVSGLDVDATLSNVSVTGAYLECAQLPAATFLEPELTIQVGSHSLRCSLVRIERDNFAVRFLEEARVVSHAFNLAAPPT